MLSIGVLLYAVERHEVMQWKRIWLVYQGLKYQMLHLMVYRDGIPRRWWFHFPYFCSSS